MRSFCEALTAGGRTTTAAVLLAAGISGSGCVRTDDTPDAVPESAASPPPPAIMREPVPQGPAQSASSRRARTYSAREFGKCAPCHAPDEPINGIGPHLVDIYGREIGAVENYRYSDALNARKGVWDAATLDRFLADPQGFAPGTKMVFRGIDDETRRAEIIAYLQREAREPPDRETE